MASMSRRSHLKNVSALEWASLKALVSVAGGSLNSKPCSGEIFKGIFAKVLSKLRFDIVVDSL